jgi:hypothetical protein
MSEPRYITRAELEDRLRGELAALTDDDRTWWAEHRVEPFIAAGWGHAFYAAAVSGSHALVFYDDEDEFGYAELGPGMAFEDGGLYGDLVDAVGGVRAMGRDDKPELSAKLDG